MMNRRGYLGGSDSGAILGLDPYRSPFQVWEEKVGRSTVVIPETLAMSLGKFLEEWISQKYVEMTGRHVTKPLKSYTHPIHSWMRGNIDRIVEEVDGKPRRLLECKSGSREEGWGDGTDEIPLH